MSLLQPSYNGRVQTPAEQCELPMAAMKGKLCTGSTSKLKLMTIKSYRKY